MFHRFLGLTFFVLIAAITNGQVQLKAANSAFVITRMAEKLHVAPRAVDDSFSVFVYDKLIESLDEGKYIFTRQDINLLLAVF